MGEIEVPLGTFSPSGKLKEDSAVLLIEESKDVVSPLLGASSIKQAGGGAGDTNVVSPLSASHVSLASLSSPLGARLLQGMSFDSNNSVSPSNAERVTKELDAGL